MRLGSARSAIGRRPARAYDLAQAQLVSLGITRLGKEWIMPVTVNKATRQAAFIADLEPDAAEKLCAATRAEAVLPGQEAGDIMAPFRGSGADLLSADLAAQPFVRYRRHELADQLRPAQAQSAGRPQGNAGEPLAEMPEVRADAVHARLGGQSGGLHPLQPPYAASGH